MKALVYTAPGELDYRDMPDPAAHEGELCVAVDAVGICGSDMHAFLGHDDRRMPPLILGHEASGRIVGGPRDGQPVVINPLVSCQTCPACLAGRQNLCPERQIISMAPRQGAFAERVTLPERNLLAMPETLSPIAAALAEPIATAWHAAAAADRLTARPLCELRALVIGGGAVGLAAALILCAQGSRKVVLGDTNAQRRETARDAGSGEIAVIDPAVTPPEAGGFDLVIDAVGAKASREAAVAAARPGGVVVHVGLLDGRDGLDIRRLTLQEITFQGVYTYTMTDFRAALQAMADGLLGPLDWFEQRRLADGARAFADLQHGRVPAAKIVLRP